jgi:mRNA-degrading endonuclease HigB of HigAB toxin-antitoxin module
MLPTFAEPEELADLIRNPAKTVGKDYAIVDVRGNDYIVNVASPFLIIFLFFFFFVLTQSVFFY